MSIVGPVNWSNPVNRAHPLNRGLVAWWLAGPTNWGGPRWYDLCRTADGTLSAAGATRKATWRPGGWSHVTLDSTNGHYASVPFAAALNITPAITVAAWIRTAATGGYIYGGHLNVSPFTGVGLSIGNGGAAGRVAVLTSDGSGVAWSDGGTTRPRVDDGKWHRVGCTVAGTIQFTYVDGVGAIVNSSGAVIASYTGTRGLGGRGGDGAITLNGDIDDVSVWNRALSPAEMWADYDLSRRGYPGALNRMGPAAFGVPATTVHPWWQYCGPMMCGNGGGV
jgi:hypothetical protein